MNNDALATETIPVPALMPSDLLESAPSSSLVKAMQGVLDRSESTVQLLEALALVLDGIEAPEAAYLVRSSRHDVRHRLPVLPHRLHWAWGLGR